MVAGDGADAIARYAEHQGTIALVLTDMMMPGMDGAALIHVLRRMNPHLRVVAASGLDAGATVERAAGAGVRHFLSKPCSAEKLLTTLQTALHEPATAPDR